MSVCCNKLDSAGKSNEIISRTKQRMPTQGKLHSLIFIYAIVISYLLLLYSYSPWLLFLNKKMPEVIQSPLLLSTEFILTI